MIHLNWPKLRSLVAVFLSLSLSASSVPYSAWAVDADISASESLNARATPPVIISGSDFRIANLLPSEKIGGNSLSTLSNTRLNAIAPTDIAANLWKKAISKVTTLNDSISIAGDSVNSRLSDVVSGSDKGSRIVVESKGSERLLSQDRPMSQAGLSSAALQRFQALNKETGGAIFDGARRAISTRQGDVNYEDAGLAAQNESRANPDNLMPAGSIPARMHAGLLASGKMSLPTNTASKHSKLKSVLHWALPILSITALIVGLDVGTKLFAAKYLFTVFHKCAWRTPLIAAIIPFIGFTAYKARATLSKYHKLWQWSAKDIFKGRFGFRRIEVSGTDSMLKEHPSLRSLVRIYDVSIAMMLGGMLGNGLDSLRFGGALDWIPLGRSLMNLADISLLAGLAFFQLATNFFVKAGEADHSGKSLQFNTTYFLGLPLVGFFIAWAFGSAPSADILNLALKNIVYLYLMGFSMLVGISRYLAAVVMTRFASKFISEQDKKKAGGS